MSWHLVLGCLGVQMIGAVFQVMYQTQGRVFHLIPKHLESRVEKQGARVYIPS